MKNKTITVYLALVLGVFGVHHFYLKGFANQWGWLHLIGGCLGLIGLRRIAVLGQDDRLSWVLAPILGLSLSAACLAAIIYGLSSKAKWNKAYNDHASEASAARGSSGITTGVTIFGVILALLVGATALMSVIAFAGQRYFEYALKAI